MNSIFKDRLIQAMEARDVKAVELAEKTGLSKARISQYMNGVYIPKSKGTHLIAKALHVEETWLMGITDNMERQERTYSPLMLENAVNVVETVIEDENYKAIVNSSALLNPDEMKMVRAMIDGLIRSKNIQNNN